MIGRTNITTEPKPVLNTNLQPLRLVAQVNKGGDEIQGTWIEKSYTIDNLTPGYVYLLFLEYATNFDNQASITSPDVTLYNNSLVTLTQANIAKLGVTFQATKSTIVFNTRWYHHGESWGNLPAIIRIYG